ncbi:MAG: Gfo/Idh/MocA family oxidoreductase [Lentisphaeria bacterium]|nr:Gfo/Idh/MocA family oxidoreductase [Lentisphaeria bacterium]
MGISLGLVGLGSFGGAFAPLFHSHPLVDRIAFCDLEPERVRKFSEDPFYQSKFHKGDEYLSLDEICGAKLDALVMITQPWLHAPQCIQAMEAGMHVYSAVPISSVPDGDEILGWCDRIVETSRRTGRQYMLGETTYYHPQAQFCRRMAAEDAFGDFVYAEGEYFHDVDAGCNLRQVSRSRSMGAAGQEWKVNSAQYRERGVLTGPMHYPTHSTSGPVCVMNAHALKVTAYGWRNRTSDPHFASYSHSNEFALFQMSNGATVRIAETREAAGRMGKDSETFRVMGTLGTFSEDVWHTATRPADLGNIQYDNLPKPTSRTLTRGEMFTPLPPEVEFAFMKAMHRGVDEAELQNRDFNPTGHGGSHPYLVHEFCEAVAENRTPAINAWEAARYMAMGVMAHKSAQRDGERLNVPDWGDAPQ